MKHYPKILIHQWYYEAEKRLHHDYIIPKLYSLIFRVIIVYEGCLVVSLENGSYGYLLFPCFTNAFLCGLENG